MLTDDVLVGQLILTTFGKDRRTFQNREHVFPINSFALQHNFMLVGAKSETLILETDVGGNVTVLCIRSLPTCWPCP